MADTKISALSAATTPLAGTEVLPIVQSGTTVKVAISDVTAGRAVSAASVAVSTGNLSFGSTGQKIVADFSNSDQSLRTAFQTSTTNGATRLTVIPNGTGTIAAANLYDRTDVANASILNLNMVGGSESQINSNRNGTGTFLPLGIYTNGTKQVNVATTGDVSVLTGNLIIGTSGKGIDFSATPGTGTSELLNDYEEGTWTPSQGAGLVVVGTFSSDGVYTKVGNLVTVRGRLVGSTSVAATAAAAMCGNLPFSASGQPAVGAVTRNPALNTVAACVTSGTTLFSTGAAADATIVFTVSYFV
jgi:hypothetical protein